MSAKKYALISVVLLLLLLGTVVPRGSASLAQAAAGGLLDPGFENSPLGKVQRSPWTIAGAPDAAVVVGEEGPSQFPAVYGSSNRETTVQPWQGLQMLRLGTPQPLTRKIGKNLIGTQPIGANGVEQTFTPCSDNLFFAFRLFSWEYRGKDVFRFDLKQRRPGKTNGWEDSVGKVTAPNGDNLTIKMPDGTMMNLSTQTRTWSLDVGNQGQFLDTGWVVVKISGIPHDGRQLRLTFSVGGNYDAANATWAYFDGGDMAPVAKFEFSPRHPWEGDVISFIDRSYDPDTAYNDGIVSWHWDIEWTTVEGSLHATSELQNPCFVPPDDRGTYVASLTVTDTGGLTNTVRTGDIPSDGYLLQPDDRQPVPQMIVANAAPKVKALDIEASPGQTVTLVGRLLDPGWLDSHSATWRISAPGQGATEITGIVQEDQSAYLGTGIVTGTFTVPAEAQTGDIFEGLLTVSDDDGGQSLGDFTTYVVADDPGRFEPDDSLTAAMTLQSGGIYQSYIQPYGTQGSRDLDVFEVVLPDGQALAAGSQILVTLKDLPADYDLVVLRVLPSDVGPVSLEEAGRYRYSPVDMATFQGAGRYRYSPVGIATFQGAGRYRYSPWDMGALQGAGRYRYSPIEYSAYGSFQFEQYPLSELGFTGLDEARIGGTDISLSELGLSVVDATSVEVAGFSANPGLRNETILVRSEFEGTRFFVVVLGSNGAASTRPYHLQIETSQPPNLAEWLEQNGFTYEAPVQNWDNTNKYPADDEPAVIYSGGPLPSTLFVTQRERIQGLYGDARWQALSDNLTALAKEDNIIGRIISVPIGMYQEADNNTDNVAATNKVAEAIRTIIQTQLASTPSIQYVVLIGSDDIIPYRRVPDQSVIGNERNYLLSAFLSPGSPLYWSILQGWILTDDYYVDEEPIFWNGRFLYVPDLPIGRLVETPEEIIASAQAFINSGGDLDAATALVTGCDFFKDGAQNVADLLPNSTTLIGDNWTSADLRSKFLGGGYDINNINAHFTHYAALSALGYATGQLDLLSSQEVANAGTVAAPALADEIVFSIGCHAGLSVTDNYSGEADPGLGIDPGLDFPQAMARQHALLVGSTGFGYGDDQVIAGTEQLMGIFAQSLVQDNVAAGRSLMLAKQRYLSSLLVTTVYDEKSSIEFTLYGLPQYRITSDSGAAQSEAAGAVSLLSAQSSASSSEGSLLADAPQQMTLSLTIIDGGTSTTENFTLEEVDTTSGSYFTARPANSDNVDYQSTAFRAVQPRIVLPLAPLPGSDNVFGVVVKSAEFVDMTGFDPVIGTLRTGWEDSAEIQVGLPQWWPSILAGVNSHEEANGLQQTLVIVPGQFRATASDPTVIGVERLYTELTIELLRPTPGTPADNQPPTVHSVDLGIDDDTGNMAVTVMASDNISGIARIEVIVIHEEGGTTSYTQLPSPPTPYPTADTEFTILVPDLGSNDGLLVQVIDGAGNVAEYTGKGAPAIASWQAWIPMASGTDSALYDVWANSSDDVFAVGELGPGESGTILRYDESSETPWSAMESGTSGDLFGVWGNSASEVFAVGSQGTILHWSGNEDGWTVMASPTAGDLRDVWGSSASDVFAVGNPMVDNVSVAHYDGSAWSAFYSSTMWDPHGVWGCSSTDVFAVGDAGTILHYKGSAWTMMTSVTELDLRGVWGSSSTDVFAVGDNATILHYDGDSWTPMSSVTTEWLYGIWGSSSSNVFAVGDNGTILHYDGSTWTPMKCGSQDNFRAISGTASDVFAVGENGAIWHYTIQPYEEAWMATYNGPASGTDVAWATAVDDSGNVYVTGWSEGDGTGDDYVTIKYDITGKEQWVARYDSGDGYGDRAYAIAVDGSGNVYVTGYSETIETEAEYVTADYLTIKYDSMGTENWTARYDGPASDTDAAYGIALYEDESGEVYVYVTGYSFGDGTQEDYATIRYDSSGNELWVARYDGPAHGADAPGFVAPYVGVVPSQPIAVDDSGNVYITGESQSSDPWVDFDYATVKYYSDNGTQCWANRYNGPANGWDVAAAIAVDRLGNTYVTGASEESVSDGYLTDVWGTSSEDVFAVGSDTGYASSYGLIVRYDGSRWRAMDSGSAAPLQGIWGISSDNVFTVGGDGIILHYDGNEEGVWSLMTSGTPNSLADIWGISSNNVFAVGANGTILHYDGVAWASMSSPTTANLQGIWGISSDNVFAVGANGTILHYNGVAWASMSSPTTASLQGIWGSASDEVFAVGWESGVGGIVLHYDGISLTGSYLLYGVQLYDIWGISSNNVFAVGANGTILHYDTETGWSSMSSGTAYWLYGIWGGSSDNVFAVGSAVISRYNGSAWADMKSDQSCTTIKYGSDGTLDWVSTYSVPGGGDAYGIDLALDDYGNVYVTGGTSLSGVNSDYLTIKYDCDGAQLWAKTYNGPENGEDYGFALAVDEWGDVYVTGESQSVGSGFDCVTTKYDSAGTWLWVARYNGPANMDEMPICIAVDRWGGVYVAGVTDGEGIWYGDCFVIRYVPAIQ